MRLLELSKPALAILACCVGIAGMLSGRPIDRPPGVLAPNEPLQGPARGAPFAYGDYLITPLASYDIEARVLSVEPYSMDSGARLAPLDFAVGWSRMSDSAVLDHFRVSQASRFFTIYPDDDAIDLAEALRGSANMHLIPATADVRDRLEDVRAGHVVRLQGHLVKVEGPGGYLWSSSLTRADTGNGACELFYVEQVARR
jgi:hypothetical protein